jgi:hypothetical protein
MYQWQRWSEKRPTAAGIYMICRSGNPPRAARWTGSHWVDTDSPDNCGPYKLVESACEFWCGPFVAP